MISLDGKSVIGWFRSIGRDRLVEGSWALGTIEINVGIGTVLELIQL